MCGGSDKLKAPTKWEVRSETPSYLNPGHLKSELVPQLSYLALALDARGDRRWGQKTSPIIGKHSWLSVLFRSRIHSTHVDWKIRKLIIQFKEVSGWTANQVPGGLHFKPGPQGVVSDRNSMIRSLQWKHKAHKERNHYEQESLGIVATESDQERQMLKGKSTKC